MVCESTGSGSIGFAVFNGLTAFVTDKYQFALCQLLSRLFLNAEYSLAVIMAGEEFPARYRGRAIAILTRPFCTTS